MRLSAVNLEARFYRVYDYPAGCMRNDLCWVDDVTAQLGVGSASDSYEYVSRVEQRQRILIIQALRWVAVDLPEDTEEGVEKIERELVLVQTPLKEYQCNRG